MVTHFSCWVLLLIVFPNSNISLFCCCWLFYLIAYCLIFWEDTTINWSMIVSIKVTATAMPISYNTLYFSIDGQIKYVHSTHTFRINNDRNLIIFASLCCSRTLAAIENHKSLFESLLVEIFVVSLSKMFGFVLSIRHFVMASNDVRRLIYSSTCRKHLNQLLPVCVLARAATRHTRDCDSFFKVFFSKCNLIAQSF